MKKYLSITLLLSLAFSHLSSTGIKDLEVCLHGTKYYSGVSEFFRYMNRSGVPEFIFDIKKIKNELPILDSSEFNFDDVDSESVKVVKLLHDEFQERSFERVEEGSHCRKYIPVGEAQNYIKCIFIQEIVSIVEGKRVILKTVIVSYEPEFTIDFERNAFVNDGDYNIKIHILESAISKTIYFLYYADNKITRTLIIDSYSSGNKFNNS